MAFGYSHRWNHPIFFYLGGIGVYFFFVLSGFLITFLLLEEKNITSTISIRNFYIRRILRIWPLYYLILLIGFFLLPNFTEIKINYLDSQFQANFYKMLFLYMLMLPNVSMALYGHVPHIGHLWTIGVEEQFYILWPLIIKRIKTRSLLIFFILFLGIIVLVKSAFLIIYINYKNSYLVPIKEFLAAFKIECMTIGAIGAYLYWSKNKILKLVYHPMIHILSWIIIPVLIFFTPSGLQDGNHLIYSLAFITIILNVSTNKKSFLKLELPILNHLGKISYGIYMYHFMIIPIIIYTLRKNNIYINSLQGNILLYTFTFIFSILIANLSYNYFENIFLSFKKKFTIIPSKL